jgi:hypothetical protein
MPDTAVDDFDEIDVFTVPAQMKRGLKHRAAHPSQQPSIQIQPISARRYSSHS